MSDVDEQQQEQYYEAPPDIPRRQTDLMHEIGSILKEISESKHLLEDFELMLEGKRRNSDGEIEKVHEPYMKTKRAISEFMQIIKSAVNLHNDFSYYSEEAANSIICGYAAQINRWLMMQSDEVPLRYRRKIAHEAMALIASSYHKAENGRMLVWSRGAITESTNLNMQQNPQQKKGIIEYLMPWRKT